MFRLMCVSAVLLFAVLFACACRPVVPVTMGEQPVMPTAGATPASSLDEALAGKYAGKTVSVGSVWAGPFVPPFQQSFKEFEDKTDIQLRFEEAYADSPDFRAVVEAGQGPDIVDFSYISPLRQFAKDGSLVDLSGVIDPATLHGRFDQVWLDAATMDGPDGPILAALWNVYYLNSLVWYPKAPFEAAGYQVPTTWEEMLALSDQIVADGGTPWCTENGFWPYGGGFPAVQWIGDILLRTAPPEDYDRWINGDLKFNSPQVKRAVEIMSDLWFKPGYSIGGREAINASTMRSASQAMFADPPTCWLMKEPSWTLAFDGVDIVTAFGGKEYGTDYDFFVLPPIDPAYGAPVVMEGHLYGMLHDRPEVRALMEYLSTGAQQADWVEAGGQTGLLPHKGVRLDVYSKDWDRAGAKVGLAAQEAGNLHYVAGDAMWPAVNAKFYSSMIDYIDGKIDLDTALSQIDAAWPASTE